MSSRKERTLFKGSLEITKSSCKRSSTSLDRANELVFENNAGNQPGADKLPNQRHKNTNMCFQVTVFDSTATSDPFMNTNELEALRKRQNHNLRAAGQFS